MPALKYAVVKTGMTHLAVTKLDVLDTYDTIKICTKYDKMPVSGADFFDAKVEYEEFNGWGSAKQVKNILPFIQKIEDYTGCKVELVSNGVNPEDIINL